MAAHTTPTAETHLSNPGRVSTFSDGVFAIIITLLVLDLHVPEHDPGQLWSALAHNWPTYVAFAVSFVYVGVLWLNHHALFRHIAHVNLALQWLNLALLFGAVVIPFPTSVIASTFGDAADHDDQRTAVLLYALLATFMSLTWWAMWGYLGRHDELMTETTEDGWARAQLTRPITGVALFAAGGIAGWLISPVLGLVSIVAMIAYHAVTSEGVRSTSRTEHADSR